MTYPNQILQGNILSLLICLLGMPARFIGLNICNNYEFLSLWLTLTHCLHFFSQPDTKTLAKNAFCSWVRAYTAHRGELKRIFMVKKLHLGHVAKSFALKEQPSLVGKSFQNQVKKRKRDEKQKGLSRKRKVSRKTWLQTLIPTYRWLWEMQSCRWVKSCFG